MKPLTTKAMKRFSIFLLATLMAIPSIWAQENTTELTLAKVKVESEAARKHFGQEMIQVRNRTTTYMPEGRLPILKVRATENAANEKVLREMFAARDLKMPRAKRTAGAQGFRSDNASAWYHPASGAISFTHTSSPCAKTGFSDFKEAVQAGLDYIARNRIVTLAEGEELDILAVSAVHNVLSDTNKPAEPMENFVSDYYVSFGRRVKDVPVVGSHVTLRLNTEKQVAMVKKNWRNLQGFGETVAVPRVDLPKMIYESREFQRTYGEQDFQPEDIHIDLVRAGYFESGILYEQSELRPGVEVSFWVGKSKDGLNSQILLPLEKGMDADRLKGKKVTGGRD
jgi:hypothetical protein